MYTCYDVYTYVIDESTCETKPAIDAISNCIAIVYYDLIYIKSP